MQKDDEKEGDFMTIKRKYMGTTEDESWYEALKENHSKENGLGIDEISINQKYCEYDMIPQNLYNYYNRYKNNKCIPPYDPCKRLKEYTEYNWWSIILLNIKFYINNFSYGLFKKKFINLEIKFYRDEIYFSRAAIKR